MSDKLLSAQIAEAQARLDAAKPGECVAVEGHLLEYMRQVPVHFPGPWGDYVNPSATPPAVDPLRDELVAMLRELEFAASDIDHRDRWYSYCKECGGTQKEGHKETCRLAALIAKAENRT
jgi:hypothetical protein